MASKWQTHKEHQAQLRWIETCGRTLSGYIKRYGSINDPDHHGDGGEAIYATDIAYLKELSAILGR